MSAPTPGNFDCLRLQTINLSLSSTFTNSGVVNADVTADVAPLQMIRDIQTARFPALQDSTKDNVVKVGWVDNCEAEAIDCEGDECVVTGVEGGASCKEYELDICLQSTGFTVSERKYRELGTMVNFDQEVARLLARELQQMDQALANRSVAFLDANAGENLNAAPYTVSATSTAIPAVAWNFDLFAYFGVTRMRNKLPNMRLLLGGLMEQQFMNLQANAGTENGGANLRKSTMLGQVYSDYFTTEAVLSGKAAFLVNPDSVAFVSKAYNTPFGAGRTIHPSGGGKQILYTVGSLALPGVVYDVVYQEICTDSDIKHTWKLRVKAGLFANPLSCETKRTGVLKFLCA